MRHLLTAAGLAAMAALSCVPAHADNVFWSVAVDAPTGDHGHVSTQVGNMPPQPVFVQQVPVVVAAAPVVQAVPEYEEHPHCRERVPVVYYPQPRYIVPAVYYGQGHGHREKGWHHEHGWYGHDGWRDGERHEHWHEEGGDHRGQGWRGDR